MRWYMMVICEMVNDETDYDMVDYEMVSEKRYDHPSHHLSYLISPRWSWEDGRDTKGERWDDGGRDKREVSTSDNLPMRCDEMVSDGRWNRIKYLPSHHDNLTISQSTISTISPSTISLDDHISSFQYHIYHHLSNNQPPSQPSHLMIISLPSNITFTTIYLTINHHLNHLTWWSYLFLPISHLPPSI